MSVRPNARVDSIDQSTTEVTNNQLPFWVWVVFMVLFVVGWVTDTPATMLKQMVRKNG